MLTYREKALLREFADRLTTECYYTVDENIIGTIAELIDKVYHEIVNEE